MSPFVDNEEEGYLPDRQREINALAGIESTLTGPAIGEDSSSDDEKEDKEESEQEKPATKAKGDADSSSDEEGTSEELDSDSEDEGPMTRSKKAAPAKKPTAKTAKKI